MSDIIDPLLTSRDQQLMQVLSFDTVSQESSIDLRIARILKKLKTVRNQNPESFGKDSHQFKLRSPLNEKHLVNFERLYGVTLPEEFRRFVLTAGDGGAGPAYGLTPFSTWSRGKDYKGENWVAKECPVFKAPQDYAIDGTISVVNEGCSFSVALIVTGPYRGRMLRIDGESEEAPYLTPDIDFLAWYEQWLDHLLWGWAGNEAGDGLPGTEADMVRALSDPAADDATRRNAMRTFLRIPRLRPESVTEVLNGLKASCAKVRCLALQVTRHQRLMKADDIVRILTLDPDASVRWYAVNALAKLEGPNWQTIGRRLLKDMDHDVMFRAVVVLKDAKALTKEDLLPLINCQDVPTKRTAIWAWGKSGFEVVSSPWFSERMHDPDIEVRRAVILACADANDRGILQHLPTLMAGTPGAFDTLGFNVQKRFTQVPRPIVSVLKTLFGIRER